MWFPLNFLIIESLQKYHYYYGDDFRVEYPTGSGEMMTLWEVGAGAIAAPGFDLPARREGSPPGLWRRRSLSERSDWRDHILFYEYFHGDTGAGLGASHQTGWTALVAKLLVQIGGRSAASAGARLTRSRGRSGR